MPSKCCAYGCKSGYAGQHTSRQISFHSFPLQDEERNRDWVRAIGRQGWQPTKYSKVCSKHFVPSDFVESSEDTRQCRLKAGTPLYNRRLKPNAIPSVFENMPTYMQVKPAGRSTTASSSEVRMLASELAEQEAENLAKEKDKILSLQDLLRHIQQSPLSPGIKVFEENDKVVLGTLDFSQNPPAFKFSVAVTSELSVAVTLHGKSVQKGLYSDQLMGNLETYSSFKLLIDTIESWVSRKSEEPTSQNFLDFAIENLEEHISSLDSEEHVAVGKLNFLLEQLKLSSKEPQARRYSSDLTVFGYALNAASSRAYEKLLEANVLTMPSQSHLRRITSKSDFGEAEVKYLKARFEKLTGYDINVIMLIDEIYIAQRVEFSAPQGKLIGLTEDAQVASTVLCFMISSVTAKYRDIVSMVPINKVSADKIKNAFEEVLQLVSNVGFSVIAVCLDNHAANRKFFKNLCGGTLKSFIPNPVAPEKRLFLLFDSVHNMKNIYNNFQKRKVFHFPPLFSGDESSGKANFYHIKELFELEAAMPVKLAYKLSPKSLEPKSIEKTKVNLCLSVFDESTISALKHYSSQKEKPWAGTAGFMEKVVKLWNILMVKVPTAGKQKRDISKDPIRSENDWKLLFLEEFATFCDLWMEQFPDRGLTQETNTAVSHTCRALADLAKYCLRDLGFNYVLLGKIQSDPLEKRFSWFRQMSGGNYYISLKQLIENERKIKAISLMKFSGLTTKDLDNFPVSEDNAASGISQVVFDSAQLAEQLESLGPLDCSEATVTYYVTGALVRSELRSRKFCSPCKQFLLEGDEEEFSSIVPEGLSMEALEVAKEFLGDKSRGGLLKPSVLAFSVCMKAYQIFSAIQGNEDLKTIFLRSTYQQVLFEKAFWDQAELDDELNELFSFGTTCEKGHSLATRILRRFFHTMMKNFVKSISFRAGDSRKRKISKLTGQTSS